jgi:hypothetical protein
MARELTDSTEIAENTRAFAIQRVVVLEAADEGFVVSGR